MKLIPSSQALGAFLALAVLPVFGAPIAPPERILPADTLVLVTVPDYTKAWAAFGKTAMVRLWNDDSMRPFREKFMVKFKEGGFLPSSEKLGIKLEDYSGLLQGQITFALVQNGWDGTGTNGPAMLFLLDAKEKSGDLKKLLTELRQKWNERGVKNRIEKIRDLDFTAVTIPESAPPKAPLKPGQRKPVADEEEEDDEAGPEGAGKSKGPSEILVGQFESLLIAGDSAKAIEKLLVRLSGGSIPVIGDDPLYEANHQKLFREGVGYAWINLKPLVEATFRASKEKERTPANRPPNPFAPSQDKLLTALGLTGLDTLSLNLTTTAEGSFLHFFVGAPESRRKGFMKLLAVEAKETAPPPFVPGDVTKYSRVRLDGQKAWATLESILNEVSPQLGGLLQMSLAAAGKDIDPGFDLKKSLIGNLGDDVVSYEKAPRADAPVGGNANPPSLTLIASPNPEQFVLGIKAFTGLMPPPSGGAPVKEREFLGRKIYSFPLPPQPSPKGGMRERTYSFAATKGYAALSEDEAILEEFLRNTESTTKPLSETAGLNEAAQKIGGLATGFFGYENYTATIRQTLERLRSDPKALDKMLDIPLVGGRIPLNPGTGDLKDYLDFALLPPFERIAKYFTFTVYAAAFAADGLNFRLFYPAPPETK